MARKFCAPLALAALIAAHSTAFAAPVTVLDNYQGGTAPGYGDVVGSSTFDTQSATFERVGPGGGTLRATINTNYAGAPETGNSLGTGYGHLFITPGFNAWSPVGAAPYANDIYQAGDWAYAFTMPFNPGAGTTTGSGDLYDTTNGVIDLSHVGGNYTGPNFRNFQAVRFIANNGAPVAATGTWTVSANKIVFDINDNNLLGNNFAFSWAMTCANDVIQGNVAGIPEPSTWALLIGGFGMAGGMLRRRRVAAA